MFALPEASASDILRREPYLELSTPLGIEGGFDACCEGWRWWARKAKRGRTRTERRRKKQRKK
jgi:hypothetical protein